MSPMKEGVSLKPLVDHFDDKIEELRKVDLPDHMEQERTKTIHMLQGVQQVVRGLCMSTNGDSDYPVFCYHTD